MKSLSTNAMGILADNPDAPGLTPCIQQLVDRANLIGMPVYWIHNGWDGLLSLSPQADNSGEPSVVFLNPPLTRNHPQHKDSRCKWRRAIGHSTNPHPSSGHQSLSRRKPSKREKGTPEDVKKTLDHLGIGVLVTIGSDETLFMALQMDQAGVPVVAIPKPWPGRQRQG